MLWRCKHDVQESEGHDEGKGRMSILLSLLYTVMGFNLLGKAGFLTKTVCQILLVESIINQKSELLLLGIS